VEPLFEVIKEVIKAVLSVTENLPGRKPAQRLVDPIREQERRLEGDQEGENAADEQPVPPEDVGSPQMQLVQDQQHKKNTGDQHVVLTKPGLARPERHAPVPRRREHTGLHSSHPVSL
jgi:hypothetical protein